MPDLSFEKKTGLLYQFSQEDQIWLTWYNLALHQQDLNVCSSVNMSVIEKRKSMSRQIKFKKSKNKINIIFTYNINNS